MKINNPIIKAQREKDLKDALIKWKRTVPEWFGLPEYLRLLLLKDIENEDK